MVVPSQCPHDMGEKSDAFLVAGETVQVAAAIVHILVKFDHLLQGELMHIALIGFVAGTLPNVAADDIEVCSGLGHATIRSISSKHFQPSAKGVDCNRNILKIAELPLCKPRLLIPAAGFSPDFLWIWCSSSHFLSSVAYSRG